MPEGAGDAWTWTALDADSKLVISWFVGPREAGSAFTFIHDLRDRVVGRPQITSDGLMAYRRTVEDVFGSEVDYASPVKLYGPSGDAGHRYRPPDCIGTVKTPITGNPTGSTSQPATLSAQNLNVRMGVRRFTRLTNAFGKKLENQLHTLALYFVFYNLPHPRNTADLAGPRHRDHGHAARR